MFLAIDHSQVRSENGLYTGEEVCAVLSDDGIAGIEQIGVEMELDDSLIAADAISDVSSEESIPKGDEPRPQHDGEDEPDAMSIDNLSPDADASDDSSVDHPTAAIVAVGGIDNMATISPSPRPSLGRKLYHIRRQLLTRATTKIKSLSSPRRGSMPSPRRGGVSSPKARKVLEMASDNSTCTATTRASRRSCSSSIATSHSEGALEDPANRTLGNAASSITASTCDFSPDLNHHAVFESYLVTNPWEAAKRGDYATLSYIANHDDANIWTMEDGSGNVPLYYACTSYSSRYGLSFGKYGLESVKLLLRVWPEDVELPASLLEQCSNNGDGEGSSTTAIHRDVVEILARSKSSRGRLPLPVMTLLPECLSLISEEASQDVKIEGVKDVVPVSFLEDLGDDGYVEDY